MGAEMDSQKIHLCLLLIDRPIVVDAHLIDLQNMWFILVVPKLGIDVRCRQDDVREQIKGMIRKIYKQQELPDSKLYIEWKDGTLEEYVLFDKMRILLSSVLKTPIDLVTKIIPPHKRKYAKAVNAVSGDEDEEEENDEDEQEDVDLIDEVDEKEKQMNEKEETPVVAMSLEAQLKTGTCDYYAGTYD